MIPWPHQLRAHDALLSALTGGISPVAFTSPTGGGKSEIMFRMIEWGLENGRESILYTNRKFLLEQMQRGFRERGIEFGTRASGHEPALLKRVQLSSIQTEASRVYDRKDWEIHPAGIVFIDEAHTQGGAIAARVVKDHLAQGAFVVLVTATPTNLEVFEPKRLIVAGVTSELRSCGALVPCDTYGPTEPDCSLIGKKAIGEDYSENELAKIIKVDSIFGHVSKHLRTLNPELRPTILFASSVGASLYFAEHLSANGIRAAHVDGDDIWFDGDTYKSDPKAREDILAGSKSGEIKVVCNRFVLREAIDMPWLAHGIMATVFGSLTSYLQSGGRLLRAYPGLSRVILQDHGGNWWRHGSLNADREWAIGLTDKQMAMERARKIRDKEDREPIHCPFCHAIRLSGDVCPRCGRRATKKTRYVLQHNGTLREMHGDIYRERTVKQEPDTARKWKGCVFRIKHKGGNFNSAVGLFYKENGYWPPKDLPYMPLDPRDFHRPIKSVPYSECHREKREPEISDPQETFL
jgi:superfamily II DNA or RNA helicase